MKAAEDLQELEQELAKLRVEEDGARQGLGF